MIEATVKNWTNTALLILIQFVNIGISLNETKNLTEAIASLKNCVRSQTWVKRQEHFVLLDGQWNESIALSIFS